MPRLLRTSPLHYKHRHNCNRHEVTLETVLYSNLHMWMRKKMPWMDSTMRVETYYCWYRCFCLPWQCANCPSRFRSIHLVVFVVVGGVDDDDDDDYFQWMLMVTMVLSRDDHSCSIFDDDVLLAAAATMIHFDPLQRQQHDGDDKYRPNRNEQIVLSTLPSLLLVVASSSVSLASFRRLMTDPLLLLFERRSVSN